MKKFILFFILIQTQHLLSQTVLATTPLELKKSKEYRQIINAENTATQEVFAFVSDKETITILKYNSALFLTDKYTLPRPAIAYKLLSGYSFNAQGNPTLYWTSNDLSKIMAVQYDLNTKTNTAVNYEQQFFNQETITQIQANDAFYILAQKHFEQKLVLYVFKEGKKEEKTLDFGTFKFKNSRNQDLSFSQILEACPIEKMETSQFNPLFKGTQKTKLYVLKNKLLLTFDHNDNETQAFEIDLATFAISEKTFPKSATKDHVSLSNSYYHEGKIYQIKINYDDLLFEIKDYNTAETLKSFLVTKTETIPFKTSPFWLQVEGEKPKEIKNTAKFLNHLVYLEVGLTVYKTSKSILITLGGTGKTQYMDNYQDINLSFINIPTTVYFESTFDKKLNQAKKDDEPLAVDYISQFIHEHPEVTSPSIIRHKNHYIMGYYDSYAKQYTMRKFIDGFDQ